MTAGRPIATRPCFAHPARGGGDYASTKSIISIDPPAHTRLRQLVTGPFRPAAIAALEPELRKIAEGLVDELVAANRAGEADLVTHLAVPLPVIAIARMLAIPSERYPEFRHWSDHSVADLAGLDVDPAVVKQARRDMMQFFLDLVTERRRSPGDDLISAIVSGPEPLDDEFAVAFCFTLLVAGNETTTNLIGNAMLASAGPSRRSRAAVGRSPSRPERPRGSAAVRPAGPVEYPPGRYRHHCRRPRHPRRVARGAADRVSQP